MQSALDTFLKAIENCPVADGLNTGCWNKKCSMAIVCQTQRDSGQKKKHVTYFHV